MHRSSRASCPGSISPLAQKSADCWTPETLGSSPWASKPRHNRANAKTDDLMNVQQPVKGTVVPTLRYRDVPAAIAWLCTAFGFEKQMAAGTSRYRKVGTTVPLTGCCTFIVIVRV